MKIGKYSLWATVLLLFVTPLLFTLEEADEEEQISKLKEELEILHQRVSEVESLLQEKEGVPVEYEDGKAPLKTVYDEGYFFVGHNDVLKINGYAQADYRHLFGDHPGIDQFLIRRARLDIQGTLEQVWGYRLYMSFGGAASARLQDAWLEYKKWEWFRIRMGQFKEPFSLEALTSSAWIRFIERPLGASNLAPFEDIGIQLFGSLDCGRWIYAMGLFNGQGKNQIDMDDSEDFAIRLTYQPFRYHCASIFRQLYLGGGFTTGYNRFNLDGKKYYTSLRTPFQTFGDNVQQSGNLFRLGLEFDWCWGPLWLGGEYIHHRRRGVKNNGNVETISTDSWSVSGFYLITGENQPKHGPVRPCKDFDPCQWGSWGAWEIGFRYDQFQTNHKPFSKHLLTGSDRVREYTLGFIWWPNNIHIKISGNCIYADFHDKVIVNGHIIKHEKGAVVRGQYVF